MTLKPCLSCGTPTTGSRCPDCRPADVRDHIASVNNGQWQRLSKSARRMQPWCLDCRTTENLCADHIIPVSVAPELAYSIDNLTVRCSRCNGRRGNTYTTAEAESVCATLQASYKRHPTRRGRERIAAAQKAVNNNNALTRGDTPQATPPRSAVSRRGQ